MSRTPYAPLPPATVEVGLALVRARQWTWPAFAMAILPDGRLLEVRRGAAPDRAAVPYLPDDATVGSLLAQLQAACAPTVRWEVGERRGQRRMVYWVRLTSGIHTREWTGECLGEAVGRALLARWERLT